MCPAGDRVENIRNFSLKTRELAEGKTFRMLFQVVLKKQEDAIFSKEWLDMVKNRVKDPVQVDVVAEIVYEQLSIVYNRLLRLQMTVAPMLDRSPEHWEVIKKAVEKLYPPEIAVKVLKKCRDL